MKSTVPPELREIIEALHYRPAVSIIMPFEPKMIQKDAIAHSLKKAAAKVEEELEKNYPDDIARLVIQKLKTILRNLNFNTHKKSIAIYVSPVFEKVLYLDISVEEKIIIDESFEIRDLVYSKKQLHKYLVLLLSGKECRMFMGNSDSFAKILSNNPETVYAYINEVPEKVANFSDGNKRKEIVLNKFLHHIDNELDIILKAYPLPLFVMGAEKVLGYFKKITLHSNAVIEYIHGNYDEFSEDEIKELVTPYLKDWKKVMTNSILKQLEEANSQKKLAIGIKNVWRQAMNQKGKLLVVEKDFMYAAEHGGSKDQIYKAIEPYNKFSYIKDAVDDIIEKVLENGGDVEFTDKDVLKDYHRIALVQYY